jgi:chemotaxis protein CheX
MYLTNNQRIDKMDTTVLKVFVSSAGRFFSEMTGEDARVTSAYLRDSGAEWRHDYAAMIGVSGQYRGNVYFTAPRPLVEAVLTAMGESGRSDQEYGDLVGEITNCISGNSREVLGGDFIISTPHVLKPATRDPGVTEGTACYVIPIQWRDMTSHLLVALAEEGAA